MDVDAVVFDVYGTLLEVGSLEATCAKVIADAPAMVRLWRQKQLEYTWLRGLMGRYEDFWEVTSAALEYVDERLELALDETERSRLMNAWLEVRPYPDVSAALDRLAPRPLAVLSNGSPRMLEAGLRAANLRDRFEHVLSVDEVRTFKPDPAVYELAARTLSLSSDRIVFVSANAWDVAGAGAYGLQVAWVKRAEGWVEKLGFTPDLLVDDLEDLVDRLTR